MVRIHLLWILKLLWAISADVTESLWHQILAHIQIEYHQCWINHCSNVATTMPIDVFTSVTVPPLVKHKYWSQICSILCLCYAMLLFRIRFITIILGRHRRRWLLPSFHHAPGRLSVHSKRRSYRFGIFSFQNYLDISNIDGSELNCSIVVANALETPQSLTKPSICVPG